MTEPFMHIVCAAMEHDKCPSLSTDPAAAGCACFCHTLTARAQHDFELHEGDPLCHALKASPEGTMRCRLPREHRVHDVDKAH